MPKVSVLTPIYRPDEKLLRATIESVLGQTFSDFEFLLLDDCPNDSREAVVRSYDDPRIVYLRNERNLGITLSRNRLLDLAKGEYLAVLDHDDVCRADRFEKEVAYLDAHPDCGVVSSWIRELPAGTVRAYPTDDHAVRVRLAHDCIVQHSASMIRKAALVAHGLRYERPFSPSEDHALWVRLLPHVGFHIIPEPLLDYRWHADNTTLREADKMKEGSFMVQELAKATVPDLCAEYYACRDKVAYVKLLGIPFLKIVTSTNFTTVKLFDFLPVVQIKRKVK